MKTPSLPKQPWTQTHQAIIEQLDVSRETGLDERDVENRRDQFGLNRLRETMQRGAWQILIDQFKSLVVVLLIVAAIVAMIFGEWIDSIAIAIVVIVNAAIGFFTEMRAVRSMEALKQMGSVTTKVRRAGQLKEISAEKLVPGDLVVIDGGDVVTADLRLIEASKLQADESAVTGESVPVSKQIEPLEDDVPLAERSNMLFKGTAVTRGAGEGVVVATGMETELGQISALVEEADEESTPLEKRLDQLGRKLIGVTLTIAALVAVIGILQGREILLMIETSIALAVAAIPEGLPIVATIALAQGMRRMSRRNALVNRLAAVETLGGTTVICTDKTGTLTENQMTATRVTLASGTYEVGGEGLERAGEFHQNGNVVDPTEDAALQALLKAGVFCNNASIANGKHPEDEIGDSDADKSGPVGDPMEIALLIMGAKAGLDRDSLLKDKPEEREEAFDPEVKMMATFHQDADGSAQNHAAYQVAVKGAPEAVLAASSYLLNGEEKEEMSAAIREHWLDLNQQMAANGLRVLALARKSVESVETDPYQDLTFLGVVGLLDPPRNDVEEAISACKAAGINVVIVTGDQVVTARNVGQAVGLVSENGRDAIEGRDLDAPADLSADSRQHILQTSLLARVSPKQKLDLIELHQKDGAIVAMTGDGVNDAPALKKADIGIAMGQRGTQVAREAADMVLQDDAFSTIVVAVEQGRVIFDNIRKFVLYLLSCNISEIMAVSLASAANMPLPVLPLQILFLNLVTDVFPALALGVGRGDAGVMKRPPRDPQDPVMTRQHWYTTVGYGVLITAAVLGALTLASTWLGLSREQAVTVSFLTLAFAQLWHVFNMRDRASNLWRNEISQNKFVWGALILCTLLLLIAVYVPGLAAVLSVVDPGLNGWLLVLGMSVIPLVIGQILKLIGFIKV